MAVAFNYWHKISGILDGELQKTGELYAPYVITTSSDEIVHNTVKLATTNMTLVATFLAVPVGIKIVSPTGGILVLVGDSAESDNNCIILPANFPIVLPGQFKAYSATAVGRGGTATIYTYQLYFKANSAPGYISYWAIF